MPIERVSGVGRSSLPDGEFTVPDLAADAIALCDAIGVGPVHVMGFSLVGVPGQAHQPFQEDPAAFNETVLGFWESVGG